MPFRSHPDWWRDPGRVCRPAGGPWPAAFLARTWMVYAAPFTGPDTVCAEDAAPPFEMGVQPSSSPSAVSAASYGAHAAAGVASSVFDRDRGRW